MGPNKRRLSTTFTPVINKKENVRKETNFAQINQSRRNYQLSEANNVPVSENQSSSHIVQLSRTKRTKNVGVAANLPEAEKLTYNEKLILVDLFVSVHVEHVERNAESGVRF